MRVVTISMAPLPLGVPGLCFRVCRRPSLGHPLFSYTALPRQNPRVLLSPEELWVYFMALLSLSEREKQGCWLQSPLFHRAVCMPALTASRGLTSEGNRVPPCAGLVLLLRKRVLMALWSLPRLNSLIQVYILHVLVYSLRHKHFISPKIPFLYF